MQQEPTVSVYKQVEVELMTPEDLAHVAPGEIFRVVCLKGDFFDYDGTYMFIAKRDSIEDWSVYGLPILNEEEYKNNLHIPVKIANFAPFRVKIEMILSMGMKLRSDNNILRVVPCTDEMLSLYRK